MFSQFLMLGAFAASVLIPRGEDIWLLSTRIVRKV